MFMFEKVIKINIFQILFLIFYIVLSILVFPDTFELTPGYKVEKLRNARGRSFVCEITAPEFHIFLSADAEKDVDVLVFLLQSQIRLKNDIKSKSFSQCANLLFSCYNEAFASFLIT